MAIISTHHGVTMNWLALGACIYGDVSINKALKVIGLTKNEKKKRRRRCGGRPSGGRPNIYDWDSLLPIAYEMLGDGLSVYKVEKQLGIKYNALNAKLRRDKAKCQI